jgi:acetyl-CoA carboxylase biotin carboxylase subunit
MGEAALTAVREVSYTGAGTIEFLLDTDGSFYFMEMNTRVQVEHPVTEEITMTDIICEQIRIAAGEPLSFKADASAGTSISPQGHAIEFRINAEDPQNNFRPSPGTITKIQLPGGPGVRVDTHVYAGYTVPPTYDSLIAKLIVWGKTRNEAILRAKRALDELVIEGIHTTTAFHRALLDHPAFVAGDVQTDFLERYQIEAAAPTTAGAPLNTALPAQASKASAAAPIVAPSDTRRP